MKVMIVNELMTGDISPVAPFNFEQTMITGPRVKVADSAGVNLTSLRSQNWTSEVFSLFFWEIKL